MTIFITGIESFLGDSLTRQLKLSKIKFTGIDIKKTKSHTKKIDINDKNLSKAIPNNCKTVVHLCAASNSTIYNNDRKKGFKTNINGLLNLINACKKKKVKQIIFASREWVYGEDDNRKTEKSKIFYEKVSSEYALSKIIGENFLRYYSKINKFNCIILRFGIIYGPRNSQKNWSAVESILQKIYLNEKIINVGSKNTSRRFIFVDDISSGIISCFGRKGYETFNLTGNKLISLNHIVNYGNKILKKETLIKENKPSSYNSRNVINNLIKKKTKWSPKVDFLSGVKLTIRSIKKFNKKPNF